jgi:hypothetical protein
VQRTAASGRQPRIIITDLDCIASASASAIKVLRLITPNCCRGDIGLKHKRLDLASEIKRASLPAGLPGFLYPVFEAVSNSLHSIEDKYEESAHEDGYIKVEIDIDAKMIVVEDNGEGFTAANLDAFLTPFTGNKLRRNGKGFGRFVSFKIFDQVFYASPTQFSDGRTANAVFEYTPLGQDDNLKEALLHKSPDCRTYPIPGQTYPTTSVTGTPRAVKPFMMATLTWNSAT